MAPWRILTGDKVLLVEGFEPMHLVYAVEGEGRIQPLSSSVLVSNGPFNTHIYVSDTKTVREMTQCPTRGYCTSSSIES